MASSDHTINQESEEADTMLRDDTRRSGATEHDSVLDFDWLIVGSGFGGSVAALRLAEKGYQVGVIERGRRYEDDELPRSASDTERYSWNPKKGLYGIMRPALFRHVVSAAQTGVGGGSLMYGGVLFRPQLPFYEDPQWHRLGQWEQILAPHFATAERMLGVRTAPWQSATMALTKEVAAHFGSPGSFALSPTGVFFGEPGKTVPDPYFGGEGPDRTGCRRCGECMVGCHTGAANRLTKNYLWFAEKGGASIMAEQEVIDVTPLGAPDGSDGYRITTEARSPGRNGDRSSYTARGVVFAGGAIATNELLADCKHRGSLGLISDRLGELVRTNSETVLSVLFPKDLDTWRDVTASSRVILDQDSQIEFLTLGPNADAQQALFTVLTGAGSRPRRIARWLGGAIRHPRRLWSVRRQTGWSTRTLQMLVMQPRDNALRFRAKKRRGGNGYRLVSESDPARPAPTHIEIGHRVASWVAEQTGGVAESSIFEAFFNIPQTAHMLGGAVIGADPSTGVIDEHHHVFGYRNLIVCDASALPANPGVNPALTITALAEHAMSHIPVRLESDRKAA
ncbi:GMC family oxidoreductase [Herbiconiux sp. CPCC 203407]|uniref:Cholesterol oxidase n=1 Tax=Herbiconiux oxytropis TaxID=2970915 RepID=A0AA42BUA5_9MICO|nr:GMC family oxidoreductase [Herbiconiux oxytropis]MCS5721676.1 GMC family oxidoreductase [Herbiconiux oxytropis]MCS5726697.1 GMC family oxidoreductase [Herbiconiux oxytropis]